MKLRSWQFMAVLVLTSALAVPALQQAVNARGGAAATEPGWSELMGSMQKMHQTMASTEPSGHIDVDFVKLMLLHHEAAIDMAKIQLVRGQDPQIDRLAQEIITDQKSEIDLMQLWLKQHEPDTRRK